MTDIEELKIELRRRALMADDNMGDSEAFDNAADAIESLQRELEEARNELERFYTIADTMRKTSTESESPEKRMWMKIAADALDAQRGQQKSHPLTPSA